MNPCSSEGRLTFIFISIFFHLLRETYEAWRITFGGYEKSERSEDLGESRRL